MRSVSSIRALSGSDVSTDQRSLPKSTLSPPIFTSVKYGLAAGVVRLLGVHFFEHLQKQQVGNLRDVGDGVGDVGFPHHFAETFEQILERGVIHEIMRRQ